LSPYCKRHMAFSKADESLFCSCKTWQFLQTCIITFKKQVQLRVFCWRISKLFLFVVFK
jgi:hypothetical protein